jgi:hypothetical protein
MEIQFHWNQSTEDGAEPARTILWVLSTHYQLLLAFEEALPRSAINKNSEWRKIMQSFKKKVEKQVVRLAPLL